MKTIITVSLLLILAVSAQAGIIHDIQTGVYPEGSYLTPIELVVVAVAPEGYFVSEAPHGAYDGIYVPIGTHNYNFVVGDLVSICAPYVETGDLSELDVRGPYTSVTYANGYGQGYVAPIPAPSYMSAAELLADEEMWESCMITITDGMEITNNSLPDNEWETTCEDGNRILFGGFWVNADTVERDTCYSNATGIYFYSRGTFKLEAFDDGIDPVSCSVPTEMVSFSDIKALYR